MVEDCHAGPIFADVHWIKRKEGCLTSWDFDKVLVDFHGLPFCSGLGASWRSSIIKGAVPVTLKGAILDLKGAVQRGWGGQEVVQEFQ